jgi:hypothetical protein
LWLATVEIALIIRWYDVAVFMLGVAVAAYGFVRLTYGYPDGLIGVVLGGAVVGMTIVLYRMVVRVHLDMTKTIRRADGRE